MKVTISTDKLARGGKEKQLLLLASGLLQRGHDVLVLSKNEIDPNNYYEEIQFPIDRILTFGKGNSYGMRKRYEHHILKFQPDVILNFDVKSSLWTERFPGKLKKIPAVNCTIRSGTAHRSFKSRLLSKLCLRRSEFIVANSAAGLRIFNIQPSKTHLVIYNGIEVDRIKKAQGIPRENIFTSGISRNSFVIANTGSLYEHKGQLTLIEAIGQIKNKDIFAFIIGEGPQRDELQATIDRLHLSDRVKLLGRQSNVEQYLKSADIFINPSWGEGCSNAILEAMTCGLPVITTSEGGTTEIVHSKSAKFFRVNDSDDLSSAIKKAMNSGNFNTDELYHWIQKYEVSNMVDRYESFIKKTVLNDN